MKGFFVKFAIFVMFAGNLAFRNGFILFLNNYGWISLLFSRTASQFITVAITIERFLVITFPFATKDWFTPLKTKLICVLVFLFAFLLAIPRLTSRYVAENIWSKDGFDVPAVRDLPYILRSTRLNAIYYKQLKSAHFYFDFWVPLPVLLILNFLSYLQVSKLSFIF